LSAPFPETRHPEATREPAASPTIPARLSQKVNNKLRILGKPKASPIAAFLGDLASAQWKESKCGN
jgi:hypothetical protein